MAKITIALAVILTLLGVGTYFGSPDANPSKTALIPSVFGVLLLGCGLAALRPSWQARDARRGVDRVVGSPGGQRSRSHGGFEARRRRGGEQDCPRFRAADGGHMLAAGRAVRQQLHRRSPPSGGRRGGIRRRRPNESRPAVNPSCFSCQGERKTYVARLYWRPDLRGAGLISHTEAFGVLAVPADLSTRHQPIGGLFHLPASREQWDQYRLTDEQVAFYHEHGYLSGVRVMTDEQIEQLRAELAEFFDPQHAGRDLWYEYHTNESADPSRVLFHALGAWRISRGFTTCCGIRRSRWRPASC